MAPKLLLAATTSWPTAGRLAAAFARLAWQVEAIVPADAPARASRFVTRVHRYSSLAQSRALENALLSSGAELVIPCDDRVLGQLLQLHSRAVRSGKRKLAAVIARSLGAPEQYPAMMARPDFIAAAETLGIKVPHSHAILSEADLEAGLEKIGLPVVLKQDGSWGGEGVVVARTIEEARAAYRRMAKPLPAWRLALRAVRRRDGHHLVQAIARNAPVLSMQAYVSGTAATTSFAAWQGRLLVAVHFDVVASEGETGPASLIRRVDDPAMADAARKIAQRFGLSGIHGLDFIRDASGAVHLLEINPRATQTAAQQWGGDCDLMAALASAAEGTAASGPVVARGPAISRDIVALFPAGCGASGAQHYPGAVHFDLPADDPAFMRACTAEKLSRRLKNWASGLEPAGLGRSLRPGNHTAIASKP